MGFFEYLSTTNEKVLFSTSDEAQEVAVLEQDPRKAAVMSYQMAIDLIPRLMRIWDLESSTRMYLEPVRIADALRRGTPSEGLENERARMNAEMIKINKYLEKNHKNIKACTTKAF